MRLYDFWSSSAAYRVRIALGLKGLAYERVVISRLNGVEDPGYYAVNPQGFVPTLEVAGRRFIQSLAILEWLEERHPTPPLLPTTPEDRARVRALMGVIACDIQPLNNQRVQDALLREFGLDAAGLRRWYERWIGEGFAALERLLAESLETGPFCHGETPTLADVCLVPQVFNARRWGCDLASYPTIRRIDAACCELPAFRNAAPERQAERPEEEASGRPA
ncbi:maleylacetoacetate isomerase [Benzoatithermus flavus]|uniref:Maleylacetoacetate isomerase n=1 Tax=Benzoatithermus flavus TaxID=3108223 RepID=A0ABU8XWL9_9PROT